MERIPLFPLRTVLFPKQALPLHIFEERYKLMINHCIDEQAPFGAVLIKSGEEVGGSADPYDVGTSARVTRVQRLPDGRMNLIALGRRRFRIVALDRGEPYLMGDVEYIEEREAAGASEIAPQITDEAERVAALFAEQFRLVLATTGQWTRKTNLPGDPAVLADLVAARVDVPPEVKQRLLETLPLLDRLRKESEILGDRIRELTELWDENRRKRFAGAALN